MNSQVLIYISFGFVAASLLAILLSKFIFNKAYKKAKKDLRGQIPLNQAEVNAERDRLRAEFAVNLNKLEYKIAAMQKGELDLRVESAQAQEYKLQSIQSLETSIRNGTQWEAEHDNAQRELDMQTHKLKIQKEKIAEMQLKQAQYIVGQQEFERAQSDYQQAGDKYFKLNEQYEETRDQLENSDRQLKKLGQEHELKNVELQQARKNNLIYEAKISELSTQVLFLGQELFAKKIKIDLSEKAIDKYKNKLLVQKLAMRDASVKDKAIYALKSKINGIDKLDLVTTDKNETPDLTQQPYLNAINTDSILSANSKPKLVHDVDNTIAISPAKKPHKASTVNKTISKTKAKKSKVSSLRGRMNDIANSTGTDD